MGFLLLEGGAEFGGAMAEPDRRAIALAGGLQAKICVLPAAAAPDNNHARAGGNALRWFRSLGARDVEVVPLIDRRSAGDPVVAETLRTARLIYMLGGFPGYLAETLAGSPAWQAMQEAHAMGAVLGGSSAGAMVLCQHLYDPYHEMLLPGLGLLPGTCLLPHYSTFGKRWESRLAELIPGVTLIGIDERTGMLDDGAQGQWTVYGAGSVTLHSASGINSYPAGASLAGLAK